MQAAVVFQRAPESHRGVAQGLSWLLCKHRAECQQHQGGKAPVRCRAGASSPEQAGRLLHELCSAQTAETDSKVVTRRCLLS